MDHAKQIGFLYLTLISCNYLIFTEILGWMESRTEFCLGQVCQNVDIGADGMAFAFKSSDFPGLAIHL